MNQIFTGSALVSIQGERALRLIEFTGNQAKYEIIGFEHLPVTIIDYRARGLLAIQTLLETGELNDFALTFNHQSQVSLVEDEDGSVIFELHVSQGPPEHVLWIAIGIGNSIPVYESIYENIAPLPEEDKYALIALYQLQMSDKPALSRSDLISASSLSTESTWDG